MSAPKFTPGPWKRQTRTGANRWRIVDARGHQVADANYYNEQAEDNADLIATAPDLYEAAAHAQAWISDMPHGDNCYLSAHYDGDPCDQCNCGKESVLAALDAALAKAVQP